jgi:hypothetical protein
MEGEWGLGMGTANDGNRIFADRASRGAGRIGSERIFARGLGSKSAPKTRKRCNPRLDHEESVWEVAAAMPQILRANVLKAEQGSLAHTKFLWGVVERMPRVTEEKTMLADFLMAEIAGGANDDGK